MRPQPDGPGGVDLLLEPDTRSSEVESRPEPSATLTEVQRPPVVRGILRNSTPSRPDLAPLLQRRLQAVAAIGLVAALGALTLTRLSSLDSGQLPTVVPRLYMAVHGLAALLNAAVLAVLWRRRLSETSLRWLDAAFFFGNALLFVGLPPLFFGQIASDDHAMALILLVRCIFIPDTPLRTALISLGLWSIYVLGYVLSPGLYAEAVAGIDTRHQAHAADVFLWGNFSIALHLLVGLVGVHFLHGLQMRAFRAEIAGSYRLVERLGGGGMGEVYRARHAFLRRPTAVKLIRPDLVDSPVALRRFEREVQTVSELTDPNIVAIHDFGILLDGRAYYAMEYLQGVDLQALVERFGPMPPERVVFVVEQILGALAEAHGRGILHRDIKPSNVLLTVRGRHHDFVKVFDFGLVKSFEREGSGDPGLSLTGAGSVTGSPLYMAPERFYGQHKVDQRSDLYSVGALAYYLLCGRPVFEARTAVQALIDHARTPPQPPGKLGVRLSGELEAALLASLEKDPAQRPESAEAFALALRSTPEWGEWTEEQSRRWWKECLPQVCSALAKPIAADA